MADIASKFHRAEIIQLLSQTQIELEKGKENLHPHGPNTGAIHYHAVSIHPKFFEGGRTMGRRFVSGNWFAQIGICAPELW